MYGVSGNASSPTQTKRILCVAFSFGNGLSFGKLRVKSEECYSPVPFS